MVDDDCRSERIAFGDAQVDSKVHWWPTPWGWSECGGFMDRGFNNLADQGAFGESEEDCPECVEGYKRAGVPPVGRR